MKLVWESEDIQFNLSGDKLNWISIENPVVFDRFSQSLISSKLGESEDIFLTNDQSDKILLSKQANVIYPPFRNIYSANKDMQKKVYTEVLSNIRSTDAEEKLLRLQMEEKEIIKNICFEMNYNLELNEEVNCETILKPCNIRIKESEGTFAIRVLDYAVNSEELFGFNFLFLVSCNDYIDIIEYDNLLRNLRYHGIIITVVAGTQSRQLNIEKNEHIIDYDMCVLR